MDHKIYIDRCLELARLGWPTCRPNPMVGCVIVHEGKIISEGYHKTFGGDHAEVVAIQKVSDESIIANSTIYVSLEPCDHHGKTPPCSDLIISKNPKNVVIGSLDPNVMVKGKGVEKLKSAGIAVSVVNSTGSENLNARFFTFHNLNRPHIILKWAQSTDGFIAPKKKDFQKPFWISGKLSRQLSHQWRANEMAILVGVNTVKLDNPTLTTRWVNGPNPLRIVLDPTNEIMENASILLDSFPALIFNLAKNVKRSNKEWIQVKSENMIDEIMMELKNRNIQSVLVEGGTKTIQSFLDIGLWDEIRQFIGPGKLLNGLKGPVFNCERSETQKIGEDSLQSYNNPLSGFRLEK